MKKTILALAVALSSAFGASALEYTHAVRVNLNDGTYQDFQFMLTPAAVIEGENLKIAIGSLDDGVLFPFSDVKKLTIISESSGIEGTTTDDNSVRFGLTADLLEGFGLQPGQEIAIYDASGAIRARGVCGQDGSVAINIASLDKGVYLVNAGRNSFKFIR